MESEISVIPLEDKNGWWFREIEYGFIIFQEDNGTLTVHDIMDPNTGIKRGYLTEKEKEIVRKLGLVCKKDDIHVSLDQILYNYDCKEIVDYFKVNYPKRIEHVILPTNDQLDKLASSIGLSVKYLLKSKSFHKIVENYLSNSFPNNINHEFTNKEYEFTSINGNIFKVKKGKIAAKTSIQTFYKIDNHFPLSYEQIELLGTEFPFLSFNSSPSSTSSFDILDKNAISIILCFLNPKDVLAFSTLNKTFKKNCDETMFNFLLKKHFPTHEIQNNSSKNTYKSIVNGNYLSYIVSTKGYDEFDNISFPNSTLLRDYFMEYLYNHSYNISDMIKLNCIYSDWIPENIKKLIEEKEKQKYIERHKTKETKEKILQELKNSSLYKLPLKELIKFIVYFANEFQNEDDRRYIQVSRGYIFE